VFVAGQDELHVVTLEDRRERLADVLGRSLVAGRIGRMVDKNYLPGCVVGRQGCLQPGELVGVVDLITVESHQQDVSDALRPPQARHAEGPDLTESGIVGESIVVPGYGVQIGSRVQHRRERPEDELVEPGWITVRVDVVAQEHERVEGVIPPCHVHG